VLLAFRRRIRHPFYPAVKPAPATAARAVSRALYGAYEELSKASERGVRVARAVFPIRRPGAPFLTETQRDTLWDMFRVPVYSLLVDERGEVVGYECEAQDGMHLRDDYANGLNTDAVEARLCECGRPGVRLMPSETRQASEPERLAG
jgi:hypothetical protein